MNITLQHYTPLIYCANAIRTCWQSFDKSDEGGEKTKSLLTVLEINLNMPQH